MTIKWVISEAVPQGSDSAAVCHDCEIDGATLSLTRGADQRAEYFLVVRE
jgi:hypothetical protein